MAREKTPPPDTTGECPAWFMTYSDVVTLLMTFFILLLTFSSNEPEKFEKMKVTLFGGGGARGVAAVSPDGLDKDSFAMRMRPRAARLTMRGSEMPPLEQDVATKTFGEGLAGLEEEQNREVVDEYTIVVKLSDFVSTSGDITSYGRQHLKMIAQQIRNVPYEVIFESNTVQSIDRIVVLTDVLFEDYSVPSGRFAAIANEHSVAKLNEFAIIIRKHRRSIDGA